MKGSLPLPLILSRAGLSKLRSSAIEGVLTGDLSRKNLVGLPTEADCRTSGVPHSADAAKKDGRFCPSRVPRPEGERQWQSNRRTLNRNAIAPLARSVWHFKGEALMEPSPGASWIVSWRS